MLRSKEKTKTRTWRDKKLERYFYDLFATSHNPQLLAIYTVWSEVKKHDMKQIRLRRFKLLDACVTLAKDYCCIASAPDDHREFWGYVRWFLDNRLINTGRSGRAKVEYTPNFHLLKKSEEQWLESSQK